MLRFPEAVNSSVKQVMGSGRGRRLILWIGAAALMAASSGVIAWGRAKSGGSDYLSTLRKAAQLLRQGNADDAVAAYKDAIRISGGKDYAPYWGLAQAYNALDDTRNVLSTCDQMLARATNDATRSLCHNLKGIALAKKGVNDPASLPLAEAEFREALELDSLYTVAHFNLGRTLLLENRDAEGVAEMKAYLKGLPDGEDSDEAEQFIADPSSARKKTPPASAANGGSSSTANGGADEKDSDEPLRAPDEGDSTKGLRFPPGGPAPSMEFTTSLKQKISTGSLRGKVILLDFWATWCGPCKEAYPELARIYNENDKSKLALISISEDENEKDWRAFLEKNRPAWMQARDPYGRLVQQFFSGDGTPLPSYFVIDGRGILRQFYNGWGNGQRRRVQSAINQWLAALPTTSGAPASKNH